MKSTPESRAMIRELMTKLEFPISQDFVVNALDDIDHLESQLQESRALLERAQTLIEEYAPIKQESNADTWLSDYDELKARGV